MLQFVRESDCVGLVCWQLGGGASTLSVFTGQA